MIDDKYTSTFAEEQKVQPINLYAIFFKYLTYWPWFVVSVISCLLIAFIYLRYQTPIYSVTASVLIKEKDNRARGLTGGTGAFSALQDIGGFSMSNNFDNEVEILKSRTLIKKVVKQLNLYTNIQEKRFFCYDRPLYGDSPINIVMNAEEADKLSSDVKLNIKYTSLGKLFVEVEYQANGENKNLCKSFDSLPAVMPTAVGVITFSRNTIIPDSIIQNEIELKAFIHNPIDIAQKYASLLSILPASKTTTIALLSVKNNNRLRAQKFIDTLVSIYNQDANDEKNEVARKSAEFIEDRIAIINTELGTTETELAAFKRRSGLTDLTSDAQMALQETSKYDQQRIQNLTQISLVEFLQNYINNPMNNNEVIPSNVGLQDANLTSVIDQYNTLLIERKRLLHTSSENNPAVINMNTGIDAMRHSVQTTVASALHGLKITQKNIERQTNKFAGRINDAPEQEKQFMTISRQQEIKAALYVMLLQKREENAITLAATANNGRIIEEALPNKNPLSPKKGVTILAAFILGMALPVIIIFLRDLFKYKIESREDVERITDVSILAELPRCKIPEKGSIVVRENKNDIMEETFRGLRTNLLFMLNRDERVILFSSTEPGEGKSFVSGNTAVSLAFLGKKTIIVGMDIRKPGLNKTFALSKKANGVTNYLNDPENVDLFEMIRPSCISPNLDILPGGPVPPNPTELVARPVLEDVIEKLKSRYDLIILDTAPIGMVTDTSIIARVADMCVYVCRADKTPKAGFQYINILKKERKFKHLATVINDIDMKKRSNSYGYGYGRRYGYGYGYGYGFENRKSH